MFLTDLFYFRITTWNIASVFFSTRLRSARVDDNYEGDIGIFGFAVLAIFRSVFRFLCQKTLDFHFWCSLQCADFSFFSIWFSVFEENNSSFSVLLTNVNFGFFYFEPLVRFSVLAEFFDGVAVLDDFFFGFVVSNVPQYPPPY